MSQAKSKSSSSKIQKTIKDHPSYTKWVTQGLIFSVALNLALLTSIIFNAVKGSERHVPSSKSMQISQLNHGSSLEQVLVNYSEKSFQDLVGLLSQSQHIEEGFSKRDIALSVLSHQHDVDIDRALMGQSTILRYIPVQGAMQSTYDYPVFSGITESQFKLISAFIQNERWPLTSQGLFKKLLKSKQDESLKSAFYLTREFMYIDGLFCSLSISKEVLLDILLQGSWDTLNSFMDRHHQIQDFSNALRIQFLSQYLEFGSQYAARLILEIDAGYALKKLEDAQIVALLGLLDDKTNLSENFAVHLVFGNRRDWVRQEACRLLYHYSDQSLPDPYSYSEAAKNIAEIYHIDPQQVLAGATASISPPEVQAVEALQDYELYVVQEGDTLWKIAKKHQVSLDELREANQLHTDLIKVGKTLKIP